MEAGDEAVAGGIADSTDGRTQGAGHARVHISMSAEMLGSIRAIPSTTLHGGVRGMPT